MGVVRRVVRGVVRRVVRGVGVSGWSAERVSIFSTLPLQDPAAQIDCQHPDEVLSVFLFNDQLDSFACTV